MSRKDSRRAIAIALPTPLLTSLRARQARSRGRRLMDTLRVAVAEALEQPDPVLVPCPAAPPGAPRHLLQLPRNLRHRLSAVGHDPGMGDAAVIAALVLGLDAAQGGTVHGSRDSAQRRTV